MMKLKENNIRSMLRLLGETATIPGGHAEKKTIPHERYLQAS